MSHDTEAAYASSEIAGLIMQNQNSFFGQTSGQWSVFAGREGGHQWPLADGIISAKNTTGKNVNIAFEYKRPNEGVHGILTALGQSFAYLEKGYDASIITIPEQYASHSTPGNHIKSVIESTAPDIPVCVYTYSAPNLSSTRPFHNKLTCVRDISLPNCRQIIRTNPIGTASKNASTLWAHMREGMSHPDAFFRYCQSAKIISSIGEDLSDFVFPSELIDAVHRIDANADVYKYLSNTSGDSISEKIWRRTWFEFYFWKALVPIFKSRNPYILNDTSTKIQIEEGKMQNLFSGRSDSIKNKLVEKLNQNSISEEQAWEEYAKKVRSDSHSYREVIDSGLYHIGFLSSDGYLTDLGYKYVEFCERFGSSLSPIPMEILKSAVLQNGQYGALLHYIYKYSEEKFEQDMFAFSTRNERGDYIFNDSEYLGWIDDIFANELHISKKSTERAGGTRKPFQAELSFLKKLGFIKTTNDGKAVFRVGVGLEIDWPQVQSSMMYFQGLK